MTASRGVVHARLRRVESDGDLERQAGTPGRRAVFPGPGAMRRQVKHSQEPAAFFPFSKFRARRNNQILDASKFRARRNNHFNLLQKNKRIHFLQVNESFQFLIVSGDFVLQFVWLFRLPDL